MIVPTVFSNPPLNKANIFERDGSNFDQENFILDYFSIDWDVALKLDEQMGWIPIKKKQNIKTLYLQCLEQFPKEKI